MRGKTILITGGTGSFGNAVLRKYLASDVQEIRVFSRDEKKQDDMRQAYRSEKIKYYVGDVRDPGSIRGALSGVDLVFHAAALKQVPSCEFYPLEAVRTNIMGAENVMDAALATGVKAVVILSTDKAVYPINAMGMSKALAEKLMVAKSRTAGTRTILCATRYGNVMASRGSVIPLFVRQVMAGQPITVTDPAMTRFMMFLEEAVDLVEFAFREARPGDVFVKKAPAATIADIAETVQDLFGVRREVRIIGTRHGEKLYETLVNREEMVRAEDLGGFYRIPADSRDLNYHKYVSEGEQGISTGEDYTSHSTSRLDRGALKDMLLKLDVVREGLEGKVPE